MSTPPEAITGPLPREERVEAIRQRLQAAFAPSTLEVIDDSHHHIGHAGARDGRGHYRVRVVSRAFAGMTAVGRHRAVYAALDDLMQTDIHALSIQALSEESAPETR
jgi:BolA family transcriptional regulator, general stress-responsive regulator